MLHETGANKPVVKQDKNKDAPDMPGASHQVNLVSKA
jgi:hypothetical protein